jgi:hypothetical protein
VEGLARGTVPPMEERGTAGRRKEKTDAAEMIGAAPSYHGSTHGVTMCRELSPPARPSRLCCMNG